MSHFDTSGRLALNRTGKSDFHLIIYEVQQSDSGMYNCSIDIEFEKQHVTVLHVKGSWAFHLLNCHTEYL